MKKIFLLSLAFVALIIGSCSKQEISQPGFQEREKSLGKMNFQQQQLAYSIMTPTQKYQLWIGHLNSVVSIYQPTDQNKASFVNNVKNRLSPAFFDTISTPQFDTLLDSIKNETVVMLDSIEIFLAFGYMDLGKLALYHSTGVYHFTRMPDNQEEGGGTNKCECTPKGDFCAGWLYEGIPFTGPYCNKDIPCDVVKKDCGWFWSEDCVGKCQDR